MSDAIAIVGDIHLQDRPPRNATDSYVDDLFDLVAWVADYCIQNKIRTLVLAGDVFHHKQPTRTTHALLIRLIPILRKLKEAGIEVLVVVGNHDISNDVIESVREKQPLGVLIEAGLLRELDGWHDTLPLYGVPWQQRWFTEGVVDESFSRWRSALGLEPGTGPNTMDFEAADALAVTHAPIFPSDELPEVYEAFPALQFAEAMAGAGSLYYGHIHEYHGIYEEGGVYFGNVGALSRGALAEYNVEREIKMVTWTAEDGFVEIDIPHKPASEVFKIEAARTAKIDGLTRAAFLNDIGHRQLEAVTKEGIIDVIRERKDLTRPVRDRTIDILENVPDV